MEKAEILKRVDHTLLAQEAGWAEIREVLDDAVFYNTASACIPPSFVRRAAEHVQGKLPICTVIGFPNGYHTTAVKLYETQQALADGADEIDMVIPIGQLKDRQYQVVADEIFKVKKACSGKI